MTTPNDTPEPSLASAGSVGEVLAKGIAGIIRIAAEPHWIPVTERLPARYVRVIACWPDAGQGNIVGEAMIATHGEDDWRWRCDAYTIGKTVTHWMPLPPPPSNDK